MTTTEPRTADDIRAMTPGECWAVYVGSQTPADFLAWSDTSRTYEQECAAYAGAAPTCDDLSPAAQTALGRKLAAHIVADMWGGE